MTPQEIETERRLKDLNTQLDNSFRRFDEAFIRMVYSDGALGGALGMFKYICLFNAILMFVVGSIVLGGVCTVGFGLAMFFEKKSKKRLEVYVQEYTKETPPRE